MQNLFHQYGSQYQGTDESPDLATAIPDVLFEVKRTGSLRLHEALAHAKETGAHAPVVLHRANCHHSAVLSDLVFTATGGVLMGECQRDRAIFVRVGSPTR